MSNVHLYTMTVTIHVPILCTNYSLKKPRSFHQDLSVKMKNKLLIHTSNITYEYKF